MIRSKLYASPRPPPQVCSHIHIACSTLTLTELESKEVTLIETVESVGPYLQDEDAVLRSKALAYLAQVIESLQPTFLTRQQISVLCDFFCDRIEDGGAIRGISSLQGLARFNKDMAITVFRA